MRFYAKSCFRRSALALLFASLLVAPSAFAQQAATRDLTVEQKHVAEFNVPVSDLKVTTWVDRQEETYSMGDAVQLFIKTNRDAYITVINVGTSGKVHVLFPNKHYSNNRVLAHQVLQIPGPDAPYRIRVGGPPGNELIKIVATTRPDQVIHPDRLSEQGPFFSYNGPTQNLTRDLGIELKGKHLGGQDGGAATANKVIRILASNAAVAPTSHGPAAATSLTAEELYRLAEGSFYGDSGGLNQREALRLFTMAAEAGHVGAMYRIARIHETNREGDEAPALRWYRKAADLGNTQSMVRLALIHAKTDGPYRDYAEAVRWLRKAAGQGDGVAMMNLAKMHDEGIGVEQAPREAARYVLSALRAGAWTVLDQGPRLSEETRREIQDQLRQAGFYSGLVDGRIGPETRAAMVEFARAG